MRPVPITLMCRPQSNGPSHRALSDRVFPFAFAGMIAAAVLAAWYDERPVEGQLILTDTACQLVEYHGGTIERIEGERLCVMRARFRAPERDRGARVEVVTNHGTFTVELAASQIVSHAFR